MSIRSWNMFWALPVLAWAGPLAAQTIPEETDREREPTDLIALLNLKLISPTRTDKTLRQSPAIISSISAAEMEAMGARTLSDVLKMMPGVQILTRRNGRDMVWIRGVTDQYNTNVLLMVDGIPQREAIFGEWSPDEEIPINNIERIEIIRGPGSAIYGGVAFAGIISIYTKKIYNSFEGDLSQDHLSGTRFNFLSSTDTDLGGFMVNGNAMRTKGQKMDRDRNGLPTDHHAYVESNNLQLKGQWSDFALMLSHRDFTADYPLYASGETKSQNYQTSLGALDYRNRWDTVAFNQKLYFLHVKQFHDYRKTDTGSGALQDLLTREMESLLLGLDTQLTWNPNPTHQAVFGIMAESQNAIRYFELEQSAPTWTPIYSSWLDPDKTGTPGLHSAQQLNAACYAQDEMTLGDDLLRITAGSRYDYHRNMGSQVSPRLGVIVFPDDKSTLKLLWGTAFKPPTLRQTVMQHSDGKSPGNPNLKPERITTLDFQATRQFSTQALLQAGYFEEHVRDFIESVSYAPYSNSASKQKITGVEVDLKFLGTLMSGWPEHYQMDINITHLLDAYESQPSGRKDIPLIARNTWNANLQLRGANLDLYLGLNALGRRNGSATYHSNVWPSDIRALDNLKGYQTLDANLIWHHFMSIPLRIELSVHNVTNVRYFSPDTDPDSYYDYLQEPRNLSLTLGLRY